MWKHRTLAAVAASSLGLFAWGCNSEQVETGAEATAKGLGKVGAAAESGGKAAGEKIKEAGAGTRFEKAADKTGEVMEKGGEKTKEVLDKAGEKVKEAGKSVGQAVDKAGEKLKDAKDKAVGEIKSLESKAAAEIKDLKSKAADALKND